MAERNRLIVLDFDGTLCLGEDPVLTYARAVDAMLADRGLSDRLPRSVHSIVKQALERDDLLAEEIAYRSDGTPLAAAQGEPAETTEAHPVSWPVQDGYQLIQLLAHQAGLTAEQSGACFRQARRELVDAGLEYCDLHAPAGASELLQQLRTHAAVVLITNSPAEGFAPWLETLGLQDSFDAVINDACKPFGMPAALESARAAAEQTVPAEHVLSVGDIWANDLQHVARIGGTTVLIDRFGTGLGDPDHRVTSWEDAAPIMSAWSAGSI